jgi:hypothetical protein
MLRVRRRFERLPDDGRRKSRTPAKFRVRQGYPGRALRFFLRACRVLTLD